MDFLNFNRNQIADVSVIEGALYRLLIGFKSTQQVELKALASKVEVKNYKAGERIVDIGEIQPYFFLIVNGLVRKFLINNNQEYNLQFAKEGEITVPLKSYCKEQASDVAIETIEPCLIYAFHRAIFSSLSSTMHDIVFLHETLLMHSLLQLEEIERHRLSTPGRTRFVEFMQKNTDLLQRVSQKHLASYLNIQPATFSRFKHFLKKSKR